ncbi:MAG: HU family DNA-binding protein [Chloroflexi bacterium]|jgi:nucleoid DNA-binding protein|nr:HU family DNA-binding protein [Chloroflexota bacterium]
MAGKRMSKTQFVAAVAEKSGLTKKQANAALEAINTVVARELGKKGPGEVILPGLLKLSVVIKPATHQHEGVNPFTKEPMTYKAKAARKVVKIRALKALTDAV